MIIYEEGLKLGEPFIVSAIYTDENGETCVLKVKETIERREVVWKTQWAGTFEQVEEWKRNNPI